MYLRDNAFMISCAARTGSTLLVHLLRSNPDILCHGEVFALGGLDGMQGIYAKKIRKNEKYKTYMMKEREKSPAVFLYKYVLDSQDRRIIGFKYKTDEAFLPEYKRLTDVVMNDRDIKILFLIRRSLLSQYYSHQVVLKQTGITLVHQEKNVPQIEPMKLNKRSCMAYINDVIFRQKKAEQLYAEHRSMFVFYEDIVEGKNGLFNEIQGFLGGSKVKLSSTTKKIVRRPINEMIVNCDEITSFLCDHGLEKFI